MPISLSAGMRSAVYSMGDIQSQIDSSNKRLATGKKVNSALDNARSYFAAQSYRNDADKLNTLLDGMGQARLTIDKASKTIDGAVKLLQSADSLAAPRSRAPTTRIDKPTRRRSANFSTRQPSSSPTVASTASSCSSTIRRPARP